jgi:bacterioferritin (cytochrome b1)
MNQNNKIIYPLDKIFLALELTGVEQYQRCIQDN